MTKEELKTILPHREPMLLIDEATLIEENRAVGKCYIKGDEWFLQGHFPGNPIVPGVILCEMMSQAGCVLIMDKIKDSTPYFVGIKNVKFKNMVRPGDTLEIEASITRSKAPFYFAQGRGCVDGKLAVSGEFSFVLMK